MKDMRRGKFLISTDMVETNPGLVKLIMAQCVVHRAEHLHASDAFEYYATNDSFDEIEIVEPIPEYRAIFVKEEDGSVSIKWERVR